ncbi:MAG TPA: hypothetical protein V6D20_03710 [Candidatus Obscuribacterales bacterium]
MVAGLMILFSIALGITGVLVYLPLRLLDVLHLPTSIGVVIALGLLAWIMGDR